MLLVTQPTDFDKGVLVVIQNIDCVDWNNANDEAMRIFQARLPNALRVNSVGQMVCLGEIVASQRVWWCSYADHETWVFEVAYRVAQPKGRAGPLAPGPQLVATSGPCRPGSLIVS